MNVNLGFFTPREEQWLMSEKNVLKMKFVPKKDEITKDWRKLHFKELHKMHYLSGLIKKAVNLKGMGLANPLAQTQGIQNFGHKI
jgi:hypothetical protein